MSALKICQTKLPGGSIYTPDFFSTRKNGPDGDLSLAPSEAFDQGFHFNVTGSRTCSDYIRIGSLM